MDVHGALTIIEILVFAYYAGQLNQKVQTIGETCADLATRTRNIELHCTAMHGE